MPTYSKYIIILALTKLTFLGCFIPKLCISKQRCPLCVSSGLCFGAGVLFEIASMQIFKDAHESLPDISPLVFCSSFICLFILDEIICICSSSIPQNKIEYISKKVQFWKSKSQAHLLPAYDQTSFDVSSESTSDKSDSTQDTVINGENNVENTPIGQSKPRIYGAVNKENEREYHNHDKYSIPSTSKDGKHVPVFYYDNGIKLNTSKSFPSLSSSIRSQEHFKRKTSLSPERIDMPTTSYIFNDSERDRILNRRLSMQQHRQECREYNEISGLDTYENVIPVSAPKTALMGPLGLLFILCIHSILEGIPIGIEDFGTNVVDLIIAITFHKLVIAICLGMELANAGYWWLWSLLQSLAFSLTFSAGVLLGDKVASDDIFNTFYSPIIQVSVN